MTLLSGVCRSVLTGGGLFSVKERKLRTFRVKVLRLRLHGTQSDICWRLRVTIKTSMIDRETVEPSSCLALLTAEIDSV